MAHAGGGSGGAGGAGGAGGSGDAPRRARKALLLATQALGAMGEAWAERDALRDEIQWAREIRCHGATERAGATDAPRAADRGAGNRALLPDAPPCAASAERAHQALLLVTQALGVSADAVREARAERDAAQEEHDRCIEALHGELLLWHAVRDGADIALRTALSRGANADAEIVAGPYTLSNATYWQYQSIGFAGTAPGLAAREGSLGCLRLLLAAGADRDKADRLRGWTPLHRAARSRRADSLRLLIEAGADVDKANLDGSTPLHQAAKRDSAECLRPLLEAGADVDKPNSGGSTALHHAALRENAECLRALLEAGADVDKANRHGCTPLHHAAARDSDDCMRLLLEAGADEHRAAFDGSTPLHHAARYGGADCVRLLLEAGAVASACDDFGDTPLDLAERNKHKEAAALLRPYAAPGAP